MNIINNRYKIEENIYNDFFVEAYKVEDLWTNNQVKFMNIYNYNLQKEHIDYLITNRHKIKNIKHKNLLHSEKFSIVKTIDMEETNSVMYYSISEYVKYTTMSEKIDQLNFNDRLNILLDIIMAINFMHFRGFKYIFLNPLQIAILDDKTVKLQNIAIIIQKVHNNEYTEFERRFLSPDFISENKERVKELDHYSLARMIEYLFIDDNKVLENLNNQYSKEDILNFFNTIIEDLENRDLKTKEVNLIKFVNKIIDFFEIDYKYDLIKERDNLFLENKIVGRDKEIARIIEFDTSISKKTNHTNLVMVSGKHGTGKARFLKEIGHRLKLRKRKVYSIDIKNKDKDELLDIGELLRQTMHDTPNHLKEKYSKEFSMILPELGLSSSKEENLDTNDKAKKYRIYNRITSYLKDLSKGNIIYLLLNNIQNASDDFLDFFDYLVNNVTNSNIICISSFGIDEIDKNHNIKSRLDKWKYDLNALEIKLSRLNLEEIGELTKDILGMAYVHLGFSTMLFKECDGMPRKIEELITYLYNEGKLFINKNGRWKLDIKDLMELSYIPTNIDDYSLDQLSEIREKYYEVIKTISIFRELLPKSVLIKMFDIQDNLEAILEELVRNKILEERLVDWGSSYSISNIDLKKLIYFEIGEREKINLHKKAASTIEKLEGELYESLFEELIYHLVKSMERNRALDIIMHKVKFLENKNGNRAKDLLEKAYSILTEATEDNIRLEILEKLVYISLLKEELNEDDLRLEGYINLAESLNSRYHILNYKRAKAEIYLQRGRKKLFLEQIDEIKEINKYEALVEFEVYCLTVKANIDIGLGEFQKAEDGLEEALVLALELNLCHQQGNIYNMIGRVKDLTGKQNEAIEYYKKSYEHFIADRDIIGSLEPINKLGNIYLVHLNDLEKAMEYYQRGLEVSKKYGLKKMQMIFSISLSKINKLNYEYYKELEYVLEANRIAVELQDTNKIGICQSLLGNIYLEKEKYDKAYDCYTYVKTIFSEHKTKDLEFTREYYNFLGSFYYYFGELDKSLKNNKLAKKLYAKVDLNQYYRLEFMIILVEFFKNNKFDKAKLDKFIEEYRSTIYVEEFRKTVLTVAILSINLNDIAYATKYLEYDSQVKDRSKIEFLNKIRSTILLGIKLKQGDMEQLIAKIEKDFANGYLPFRIMIISKIGSIFEKQNKYKEAIRSYVEALDNAYRSITKAPNWSLKIAYLKTRNIDGIKENLNKILDKYYGVTIDQIRIEDISKEENMEALNDYFDFTNIIGAIGKEEFSQITKIHPYGEALGIKNIEFLISKFKDDYKYNLDLILNYLAKEAFATDGFIIEFNKEFEEYEVISSLNSKTSINKNINDGILKLTTRTDKGLLVKTNLDNSVERVYKNLLSKDITGVICVPIDINYLRSKSKNKRRINENDIEDIWIYIYIETNRAFNNFNEDMLNLINNTLYLIYMNLEINKVRLIATTDKLTGAFTRKYYDEEFSDLIESRKSITNKFSVLMLDLDKFKDINDLYGHSKGDEVLKEVGAIIKSTIRNTDIFGRYGGEEFVVILKDIGEKAALLISEKIRKNVESLKIEGIKNQITLSIGISLYPNHSKFKEDLVEKADQALYHSKQTGRNKVSLWNQKMDGAFDRVDKLAGILTGISENDNKNILGIVKIVQLIEEEIDLKEKIYKFLGELLNIVDSETATIIILNKNEKVYYTRVKSNENFADTPILNEKIINRIIENKTGEVLIDWDNLDQISEVPNWNSLIVVPMIKNGEVKGLTYLSIPLNQKEFDFNALNLTKNYAGIFTSLL